MRPIHRRWRASVVGLAATLVLGACGGPVARLEVGHKEFPTDVVLGAPRRAALPSVPVPPDTLMVPPAGQGLPLPVASAHSPSPAVPGPSPTTVPPAPCPAADPRDPPVDEAFNTIDRPPVEATYTYRNTGQVERSGATAEKRDYAVQSTRTVRSVRRSGAGTDYEVASRLGTVTTTTGYRIVPVGSSSSAEGAGLYITAMHTVDADTGTESSFDPEPNLLLLQLPAEVGRNWQSVGVDRRTGVTQRLAGTVRPKSRVDACGVPLDAMVVEIDGTVRACGPTAPSGVPVEPVCGDVPGQGETIGDPQAPRQAFHGIFYIGTQFGGLSLRDEVDVESIELGAGVFRRNVATINERPGASR